MAAYVSLIDGHRQIYIYDKLAMTGIHTCFIYTYINKYLYKVYNTYKFLQHHLDFRLDAFLVLSSCFTWLRQFLTTPLITV